MSDGEPRLPETPEQWQEAVDLAHGFLAIESCRQYGLVTGGPRANVSRCEEILTLGKERGIAPREGAIETVAALIHQGK